MTEQPSDKRHMRLVSNADLKKLIDSREGSGFVTMLHPLELFMERDYLYAITRQSLDAIKAGRKPEETDNERLGVERALQQRIDFMAWLMTQPADVYMSLYPSEMDGLDELDDLQDIVEDDNRPLPF